MKTVRVLTWQFKLESFFSLLQQVAFQVLTSTRFPSLIPPLTLLDCQPWCHQHRRGITFGFCLLSLASSCSVDLSVCPHLCWPSEVLSAEITGLKTVEKQWHKTSLALSFCCSQTPAINLMPLYLLHLTLSCLLPSLAFWLCHLLWQEGWRHSKLLLPTTLYLCYNACYTFIEPHIKLLHVPHFTLCNNLCNSL